MSAEPKRPGPEPGDAGAEKPAEPKPAEKAAEPKPEPKPAERRRAKADEAGAAAAPRRAAEARKRTPPRVPGLRELEKFRSEHFGAKAGTVRVDAAPEGDDRGGEAPTTLVFVDGAGREVGRRDYHGPEEG